MREDQSRGEEKELGLMVMEVEEEERCRMTERTMTAVIVWVKQRMKRDRRRSNKSGVIEKDSLYNDCF